MTKRRNLLDRVDPAPMLARLQQCEVNYGRHEVDADRWHFDTWITSLPTERPGPPDPEGVWEAARELIEIYEFCPPRWVRAVYRADAPLRGRTMLLEGRFCGLRFYFGVRVTEVIDEVRVADDTGARLRAWGWAYETLEGHLERGRISYEVVKNEDTGEVDFVLNAHSQRAPALGPVTKLGWRLFGRRTQLRFYERSGQRLAHAVNLGRFGSAAIRRKVEDGLVLAPSDIGRRRRDRLGIWQRRRSQRWWDDPG